MSVERTKVMRSGAFSLAGYLMGFALLAILALGLALPAAADDWRAGEDGPGSDRPLQGKELRDLMEQALRELEDQLKDTLESIPLYDLPEITEEGDIIIRRLPPLDLDRDRPQRREEAEPEVAEISV